MQKALKKVFTNDVFFMIVAILGFVGELIYGLVSCINYPETFAWDVIVILASVSTLLLYLSYRRRSKNVMKTLMGAALMAMLSSAVCGIGSSSLEIGFVFSMCQLIITLLLFANHLSINSEHHSNPKKVFWNQILCILLSLLIILWEICSLQGLTLSDICLMVITDIIGNTCTVATIVCVESRLDAYRIEREAAGWTEEAGYPEGYVHEYMKK